MPLVGVYRSLVEPATSVTWSGRVGARHLTTSRRGGLILIRETLVPRSFLWQIYQVDQSNASRLITLSLGFDDGLE
jgi:hypothetical protein